MVEINETLSIPDSDLKFDFIRSSGPGGQNVNKVATAAQLRFDLINAHYLAEDVKERLKKLAGRKVTEDGILIITARRFRSQLKNRQDATERLAEMIRRALVKPKPRIKKKPSPATRERRLLDKHKISQKKQLRQSKISPDE